MNIEALNLRNLWCETETGEIGEVDLVDGSMPPVDTHPIACARFPLVIRTEYYRRRDADGGYGGKDAIFSGNSSANEALTVALVVKGGYRLRDALVIASESCERCLNALLHRFGCEDGYPEDSEQYRTSRTRCKMCDHDPLPPLNRDFLVSINADAQA